jgi:hypothetical protein
MKSSQLKIFLFLAIVLFCSNICFGQSEAEEWQKRIDAGYNAKKNGDKGLVSEYQECLRKANTYYNTAERYRSAQDYANAYTAMNESIMNLENAKKFLTDRDKIAELESRIAIRTAEMNKIGVEPEKKIKPRNKTVGDVYKHGGSSASSTVCDEYGNCASAHSGY